jgi:PAS domain S-box-containing protein
MTRRDFDTAPTASFADAGMYNRKIVFVTILLILASLHASLYLLSHLTLLDSFSTLEEAATLKDLRRAEDIIREDIQQLSTVVTDYSGWDDAYRFVQAPDASFISANLSDTIFQKLRLNILVYLDSAGRPVYMKAVDDSHRREIPFPAGLRRHLSPSGRLVHLPSPDSAVSGILNTPEGLMLLASRPVLTSEYTGPVKGALVMGRYLDRDEIKRLAATTHLRISVRALDTPGLPEASRRALEILKAGKPAHLHAGADDRIDGYSVLKDVYGNDAALIRIESPRSIYQEGRRAVMYFLLWGVGLSLLAAAVIYLLIDKVFTVRRTREELENRYRSVVANASEGIVLATPDTLAIIECNAAFSALIGAAPQTFIGRSLRDFVDGDGSVVPATEPSTAARLPVTLRRTDGEQVFTEISVSLIPHGATSALSLIVLDITERRQAESSLKERAYQYRTLTSTSMDGYWVVDSEGRIVEANDQCCRMHEYSHDELLALSLKDVAAHWDPVETRRYIEEIKELGRAQFETRHLRKDGSILDVEVSTTYMPDSGHFLTFLRDITARKQTEDSIRRLNDELEQRVAERTAQLEEANSALHRQVLQLEQAQDEISQLNASLVQQKMALEAANLELESFSYSVSHDLRAPLRHISGYAQTLLEDCSHLLDDTARNYLERLNRASGKMVDLIDGLLNLSRVSRGALHTSRIDLTALYHEIADEYRERLSDLPISFVIADGIQVTADKTLLRTVIDNLIGNACKYSRAKESPRIECGILEQDGTLVNFVRDNGVGFDMKYADRLFGAFQRLHGEGIYEGSGIGLATVQRIIHRHGGSVWADAREGEGATFYFTLGEV